MRCMLTFMRQKQGEIYEHLFFTTLNKILATYESQPKVFKTISAKFFDEMHIKIYDAWMNIFVQSDSMPKMSQV